MRKLYFLLPGTTQKFGSGGLWAELKLAELARQFCEAEIVTYRQRESDRPFLEDVLATEDLAHCTFVASWGFDVKRLVARLKHCNVVYHAHSSGYGFNLPVAVPIVAASRNTMGYWGQKSPHSPIFYLPNAIGQEFCDRHQARDIDVLVQTRKTSSYVLEQLVPALSQFCRVELLDRYVEDLAGLFNRARIYVYDSAEYWAASGVTEGFGLPPMEAMACGCWVFSSVNSALADYLDPGFNCEKIAVYSLDCDLRRIQAALQGRRSQVDAAFFEDYRAEAVAKKLGAILVEIDAFFDYRTGDRLPQLTRWRLGQLWWQQKWGKLRRKIGR
ncbi:glycosyltransferase [Synechococcus sp. PCC 7336]|uniref:glycosyltransferase n=1 Tax=Synechococcus sp. PCC 7336 TaxID=195250 RepID=UPI00034B2ED5|nr:glycosyltransferase [Synechococcus sp. PCC 7336]